MSAAAAATSEMCAGVMVAVSNDAEAEDDDEEEDDDAPAAEWEAVKAALAWFGIAFCLDRVDLVVAAAVATGDRAVGRCTIVWHCMLPFSWRERRQVGGMPG